MYLQQHHHNFTPREFNTAAAGNLGTVQRWGIDRTWPVERIEVIVSFVVSVALTLFPATAQNSDNYDNILNILQHINLSVSQANKPRTVVDCRGSGLLEYTYKAGQNLDASTMYLVQQSQGTTLATGAYRIKYVIPGAVLRMAEPLRSRTYLPLHKLNQDPVLTLTWNSAANMYSAGTINNLFVDINLIRREPTVESEAKLAASAIPGGNIGGDGNPTGYIDWDLIEQPFNVAPGISNEQRFPLALPGEYTELVFMQYLGGANVTRSPIDNSGIGDTTGHGFGAESIWRLESAQVPSRRWKWRDLQLINDMQNPRNTITQASSPMFGGPVLTATNFQAASSTMIDFLGDGTSEDPNDELGSLLNCNLSSTLKMELIGQPASVATNGSTIYVMGRRLFGDLSRWKTVS